MKRTEFYTVLHFAIPLIVFVAAALIVFNVFFRPYNIEFVDDETVYTSVKTAGFREIELPTPPTKDGWIFDGWYFDNQTFENEFTSTSFEKKSISGPLKVYAKWLEHNHVPGEWVVSKKPTCTSTGLETLPCLTCDRAIDSKTIDKVAHKGDKAVVERKVESTCVSAGSYYDVVYCSVCKYKMSETKRTIDISLSAHLFDTSYDENGIFPTVPESYDSFCFNGVCKLCSKEVFEKNIFVTVNYENNCLTGGKATYKFEKCGSEFKYERTIPEGEHILDGMPASFWAQTVVVGGEEKLCYSSTLSNIILVGDQDYSCANVSAGVFICETCDKHVDVEVYHDHVGTWKVTKAATGTSEGEQRMTCNTCKVEIKKAIPAHDFYYTVTDEKLIYCSDKTTLRVFNLVGKCYADSCDAVDVIRNVTYNYTVTPTCIKRGSIKYKTMSLPGQEFVVEADLTTHYVYDASIGENVLVSTLQNKDGSFDSCLDFVKYMAGSDRKCGMLVDGYFTCVNCKDLVDITVFNVHNGEWVDSVQNPSHCVEYGTQIRQCTDCGTVESRVIAPLGHDFGFELVLVDSSKMKFNVLRSCNRDNCTLEPDYPLSSEVVTKNVKLKSDVKPTCALDGLKSYTYTFIDTSDFNKEYVLNYELVVSATNNHKLDANTYASSKDNAAGMFNVTLKYIQLFAGTEILCGGTGDAYYVCYDCKQLVRVTAYREHVGKWTTTKNATCYSVGSRTMNCSVCGISEEEVPKTAHKYSGTLVKEEDGTFTFSVKCTVTECDFVQADKTVTPTSKSDIPSTCTVQGYTVYTYKETINGVSVSASCDADFKDKIPHIFCTLTSEHTHTDADGNYPSNLEGIILDSEVIESETENGDIVEGGYICKRCGKYIKVNVKIVK